MDDFPEEKDEMVTITIATDSMTLSRNYYLTDSSLPDGIEDDLQDMVDTLIEKYEDL